MNQSSSNSKLKNKLELKLLDNPKYSSEWINSASHLMTVCGLTEDECAMYDADQLEMLVSMFTSAQSNKNIDINKFMNPQLNATQMQVIVTGYSHGLTSEDLDIFFDPSIPYAISNWAITALCDGYNLNRYVEEGFTKDQLYEIYAGLKDGVDVSLYDKVDMPPEKMAIIHHASVLGLKVEVGENYKLTI